MTTFGKEARELFVLRDQYTFTNHGAYGVVAKPVYEARSRIEVQYEELPDLWFRKTYDNYYEDNLKAAANFLGAKLENIALVTNTTTGINAVLRSLRLGSEDVILINSWTYVSVKNTIQWVKERTGCRVMMIPLRAPITSASIIDAYKNIVTKHKIKLAIIDGIVSVPSVLMPFKELTSICKQNNVLVLLDAAHMPGQVEVKLEEWEMDFFIGNLHKWSYTPRGCAVLYVKPEHRSYIDPTVISKSLHDENFGRRFSFRGSDDFTIYCVVKEAIAFYKNIGGLETITTYTKDLATKAANLLVTRWKTKMLDISDDMLAPNMRMVKMPELKKYPAKQEKEGDITTLYGENRALLLTLIERFHVVGMTVYLQGESYVRISANVYNCLEDYEKLADAISALKEEEQ